MPENVFDYNEATTETLWMMTSDKGFTVLDSVLTDLTIRMSALQDQWIGQAAASFHTEMDSYLSALAALRDSLQNVNFRLRDSMRDMADTITSIDAIIGA